MHVDSSSFFWLGLVASLVLGLCLTAVRTRNARRVVDRHVATRIPLVRPGLLDVTVVPEEVYERRNVVPNNWQELLPLSARITMEELPVKVSKSYRCLRFFSRFSRARKQHDDQGSSGDLHLRKAEVAMLILLPDPHSSSMAQPGLWQPEFTLGTIVYEKGEVMA